MNYEARAEAQRLANAFEEVNRVKPVGLAGVLRILARYGFDLNHQGEAIRLDGTAIPPATMKQLRVRRA